MRLALLATIIAFAGSIAGFHAAVADDTAGGAAPARALAAERSPETTSVVTAAKDCPEDRA